MFSGGLGFYSLHDSTDFFLLSWSCFPVARLVYVSFKPIAVNFWKCLSLVLKGRSLAIAVAAISRSASATISFIELSVPVYCMLKYL